MYSENDWRNYLEHSWGTSPKQKEREREYNHEYWVNHRERILAARARVNRNLVNSQYTNSQIGMAQAEERRRNATNKDERQAAIDQYNENLKLHNQAVSMQLAMNMWAKKPVNDLERFIDNGRKAINSALTKIKYAVINTQKKYEKLLGWNKDAGSNMPTNQSDLNTIARERARQTINSTGPGFTRTFSGTQTTVGEARRRNPGGR